MFKKDPICNITWLPSDDLNGNDYNPNFVMDGELRLLERSILKQGWIQPVLVNPDNIIIDGFHRVKLSQQSKALRRKYDGMVPCVVLKISRPKAMLLTVRINRAKGTHAAVRMADLIKELIDEHGFEREEVAAEIGATAKEVDLLYQDSIFHAKGLEKYRYSNAWIPKESTHEDRA